MTHSDASSRCHVLVSGPVHLEAQIYSPMNFTVLGGRYVPGSVFRAPAVSRVSIQSELL